MIVDTSALVAILFGEDPADTVLAHLRDFRGRLMISPVTVAETYMVTTRKSGDPDSHAIVDSLIRTAGIITTTVTPRQCLLAAEARYRFGINFGDCFVYALAAEADSTVLTLDRDFRKTGFPILPN